MYNLFHDVTQFRGLMNLPVSDKLEKLEPKKVELHHKLLLEEIEEFKNAEDLTEQLDAILDLMYYAVGTMTEMGVTSVIANIAWEIIQESNLSKLGAGGKPIYREDGKLLKPDTFTPPNKDIKEMLEKFAKVDEFNGYTN